MYIYHNKKIDEYLFYSNLTKLTKKTGLKYNALSNIFSRQKKLRYDGNDYTIIKKPKN